MDLNFTADELAFRQEVRQWVAANLPAAISDKVRHAQRLSREDLQRWARILLSLIHISEPTRPH